LFGLEKLTARECAYLILENNQMNNKYPVLILALASLLCSQAQASIWTEIDDAGDTPYTAQVTTGSGELNSIYGSSGVDMYKIKLNGGPFSASVKNGSLFLFDSIGHALIGHENNISASFQSGYYFLAGVPIELEPYGYSGGTFVALFPMYCGSASSGCNHYPLAGAAHLVIDSWGGTFTPSSNGGLSYPIQLSGASFAVQTSIVPLPNAIWLFGTAFTATGWISRKRKSNVLMNG